MKSLICTALARAASLAFPAAAAQNFVGWVKPTCATRQAKPLPEVLGRAALDPTYGFARALGLLACLAAPASAASSIGWDQAENIKEAANQLGDIQRSSGAKGALTFIAACYKTHSLASEYSKYFEACIAQDYMQSKVLALIYQRIPADDLKKMGSPTGAQVIEALGGRMGAAFGQYKIPPSEGKKFLQLVEKKGLPAYIAIVFPKGVSGPVPENHDAMSKDKR